MSVMVTAEFKLKPESAEAVIQTMIDILPDTRAYDGCESVKSYYEPETHTRCCSLRYGKARNINKSI